MSILTRRLASFYVWKPTSSHGFMIVVLSILAMAVSVEAATPASCPAGVNPQSSKELAPVDSDVTCKAKMSNGYPLPNPACTPGAINPTVTLAILRSGKFKTACVRDHTTTPSKKRSTYGEYRIKPPATNTGENQTCELDHLISIELGGADTLNNIWPQCGPSRVELTQRYFKIKDGVENYLAAMVKAGTIPLEAAQQGIATDWTQYIDAAAAYWSGHSKKGFGRDQ